MDADGNTIINDNDEEEKENNREKEYKEVVNILHIDKQKSQTLLEQAIEDRVQIENVFRLKMDEFAIIL